MHGAADILRTTLDEPPGRTSAGCIGSTPVSITAIETPVPVSGRPRVSTSRRCTSRLRVATVPELAFAPTAGGSYGSCCDRAEGATIDTTNAAGAATVARLTRFALRRCHGSTCQ